MNEVKKINLGTGQNIEKRSIPFDGDIELMPMHGDGYDVILS